MPQLVVVAKENLIVTIAAALVICHPIIELKLTRHAYFPILQRGLEFMIEGDDEVEQLA